MSKCCHYIALILRSKIGFLLEFGIMKCSYLNVTEFSFKSKKTLVFV